MFDPPIPPSPFCSTREAVQELVAGRQVIVCDELGPGNDGDLVVLAEHADEEAVAFMAREGRGLICLALPPERCDALGLRPMAGRRGSGATPDFTISIEARTGVTTGISAADRARTIAVAAAADSAPSDLVSPGHVFPLRARPGGLGERAGHTEAAVYLARVAGGNGAAVVCQILNRTGQAASTANLVPFAATHGLALLRLETILADARRGAVAEVEFAAA